MFNHLIQNIMATKIFVNLPVKNLPRTMDFFSHLGFTYNKQFTDDKAACMVISDDSYVMLLVDKFFQTFTKKKIADATKNTEVLVSISAESREKVDQMMDIALKMGATEAGEPQKMEFMYSRSFNDPNGHIWEIVWMDMKAVNQQQTH
jgi:uncharacterized protein